MRSAIVAAPLLAVAYAQSTTRTFPTEITQTVTSGTTTYTTSFPYTNGATSYLTETNSVGVVTGMPSAASQSGATGTNGQPAAVTSQPAAVTSQPEVATIPAGLPTGINTIPLNISGTLTTFSVSVGSSTTVVLGGGAVATDASLTTGSTAGVGSASATGGSGSAGTATSSSGSSASSASASASSKSSSGASPLTAASVGIVGLGAFFAALL